MFAFDYKYLKSDSPLVETHDSAYYPYQETPYDNQWAVKMFKTTQFDELNYAIQEASTRLPTRSSVPILPVQGYFMKYEQGIYKLFTKVPRVQNTLANLIKDHIQNKTQFRRKGHSTALQRSS